jgi:hypothetical protein
MSSDDVENGASREEPRRTPRWVLEMLGPGWVEVEPGIFSPPTRFRVAEAPPAGEAPQHAHL